MSGRDVDYICCARLGRYSKALVVGKLSQIAFDNFFYLQNVI